MAETKEITKYLKENINKTKIISYAALAFWIAGTVSYVASIGIQLSKTGIQFAEKGAAGAVNPGTSVGTTETTTPLGASGFFRGIWFKVDGYVQVPALHAEMLSVRTATNVDSFIAWCEEDDELLQSITNDFEEDNPEETSLSVRSTYEVCHQFRNSLKLVFLKFAKRIIEISDYMNDIDVSDQITANENKINEKLKEYISKYELIRENVVDMFSKYDNEHNVLTIEFEDSIANGLIVFKTFVVNGENQRQRMFYIKIVDGAINEYKGVQNETIIIDNIAIKPLTRSEDDRVQYMPNTDLIMDSSD